VPEAFVDPRNQTDHHHLSVCQQVRALKTFEHTFFALVHAPLNPDDVENLIFLQEWILHELESDHRFDEDIQDQLSTRITLAKVRTARMECVLADFFKVGIDRCALDFVRGGWVALERNFLYESLMLNESQFL
jgi:hypothetical protein